MAVSRVLDRVGQVLGGRYRLLAPIGTGASASVYLADDAVLRRRVAVKVLHAALADDEAFLRRFRAEARAAAALNHPHVVAVYDWGQDGGTARSVGPGADGGPESVDPDQPIDGIPYLVTEYLGGGSVRAMLDQGTLLSPSQALLIGLETARGLEYAHRRGFVHRDIKPANLLFDEDARLRIADFGLARALAEAAWTEPMGAVLGTARYASPEQARGESLDGKSDVYSLALVIVEAVTGRVPFSADTTIGTLMARVNNPLPVPDSLGALAAPLRWAGSPDPTRRPDSSEFGAALMAAAANFDRPAPFVLAGTRAGRNGHELDPVALDPTAITMIDPLAQTAVDPDPTAVAGSDRPGRGGAGLPLAAGAIGLAGGATVAAAAGASTVVGAAARDGIEVIHDLPSTGAGAGDTATPPADPPRASVIVNPTDAPPVEPVEPVEPKRRLARLRGTLPFTAPAALAEHFGVGSFDGEGDSRIEVDEPDGPEPAPGFAEGITGAESDHAPRDDTDDAYDAYDEATYDDAYDGDTYDEQTYLDEPEPEPEQQPAPDVTVAGTRGPGRPGALEVGVIAKTLDGDPRTQPVAISAYPPPLADPPAHGGPSQPWQRTGPIPVVEVAGRPEPTQRRDADITNVENGAPFLETSARYPSPSGLLSYADSYGDPDSAWPVGGMPYDDVAGGERAGNGGPGRPGRPGQPDLRGAAARRHARDERRAYRAPRRRWPAVLAVMVLLLGIGGGFAYWYEEVRIPYEAAPALVGKNVAEIDPDVSSFFTIVQVATFDDSAPAGKILAQQPAVATDLPRHSILTLAVSAGPPPVKVPATLVGQSLDQATATLTGLGLGLGQLSHTFDENTTANTVLAVATGTPVEVPKGTDVGLVISDGPPPRTLPSVVGLTKDDATSQLKGLGLETSVNESFSDSVDEGKVISMDPAVGAKVPKGSSVTIEVSKGPPLVAVPDVSGLSVDDATTKIEDAGLVVSDVSGSPKNKVDSTDPDAGTKVKPGSKVKLTTKKNEILGIPLP